MYNLAGLEPGSSLFVADAMDKEAGLPDFS
jgi:hypothetical protein